jgi:hypothetical protein
MQSEVPFELPKIISLKLWNDNNGVFILDVKLVLNENLGGILGGA